MLGGQDADTHVVSRPEFPECCFAVNISASTAGMGPKFYQRLNHGPNIHRPKFDVEGGWMAPQFFVAVFIPSFSENVGRVKNYWTELFLADKKTC